MTRFLGLLAVLILVPARPALAEVDAGLKVQARLIPEQSEIAPGGTVTVALEESIRSGWHTYWRNPGDAGAPTDIQWTVPAGWRAGAIAWPYPKRLPAGPLMNYGYEGKPWLLVPVTAPAAAKVGESVILKAHASWLVCSETLCVPEDAELQLPLTVAGHPVAPYSTIEADFADARALLPVAAAWPARFRLGPPLDLFLAAPGLRAQDAQFFPFDEGLVKDSAEQKLGRSEGGPVLRLTTLPKAKPFKALDGVLVVTRDDGSVRAFQIDAAPGPVPDAQFANETGMSVFAAFAFALLGGLILNLMPCVLPVLAMKALAVAAHAHGDRRAAAREGLAYGAGAIGSFLAFGLAVLLLRAGGEAVGWGFQLQEPRVVAGFALLIFAVGLYLSGVAELPAGFSVGDGLTRKSGAVGAFFTGVLAVAVAAPCTAPFMAAAIGFALTQGVVVALGVFLFLGIGFAAPFVAIGLSPPLLRLLPKPGAWTLRFKQLLAFPMYAAAAWLVWVEAQEAGETGLAFTLAAFVALAFAAWAWDASRNARTQWRNAGFAAALTGLIVACAAVLLAQGDATAQTTADPVSASLHAERYSASRLAELRAEGRPVFVDATAAWCITCLVNERVALSRADVAHAFAETHTAYLVADWTRRDADITSLLAAHDRSGVPLYLYYKPGALDADVLPQILTPATVLSAVQGAN